MYRIFIYSYLAFMMSVGFAHSGNYFLQGVTSQKDNGLSRPFRVGHFKFSRKTDRIKPLGVASYAGWTSASGLLIGAVDHEWVGAFSVTNGKAKWWLHSSGELTAPPTIYGSWVILGFRDGTLLKVEVLTGKVVWKANLDTFPSRDYTLVGSKLLVITASQYLYSVDFQSGETQWLVDGGRPLGLTVRSLSAPVVYNENVYFGTSSGEIVSVSMATGKIEWRYDPEYTDSRFKDIVGEMLVVNNRLIFSRYDGLVGAISLSAKQKQLAWSQKFPSIATSSYRDGRYYIGGVNGDILAIQISDGNILWRQNTGASAAGITIGEHMMYIAGSKGKITAIETASGKISWFDELNGVITNKGFYLGKNLYFATGLRNLYGYKVQ